MAWEKSPKRRSYACNGQLLSQRRRARRWTQEQLADLSGYSVRLVAKSEAGGSLHADTIEHLAAVLSTPDAPLFPEDLIVNPKQLALEFVRNLRLHQGQVVSKCLHFLADDIRFFMPGNPEILPFAGTHTGRDAMDKACGIFFQTMEIENSDRWRTEFVVCEGSEVVVGQWIPAQLRGLAARGMRLPREALVVNRLVFERGMVVKFDDYFHAEDAEEAIIKQRELLNQVG